MTGSELSSADSISERQTMPTSRPKSENLSVESAIGNLHEEEFGEVRCRLYKVLLIDKKGGEDSAVGYC